MDGGHDDEAYEEYVPVAKRRAAAEAARRAKRGRGGLEGGGAEGEAGSGGGPEGGGGVGLDGEPQAESMLDAMQRTGEGVEVDEAAKQREAEAELLQQVMAGKAAGGPLASALEVSHGVQYFESLKTDWRPMAKHRAMTAERADTLRKKWNIIAEGEDLPPPIGTFKDMRFPPPILAALEAKGIKQPTPIQVQGVPVALSGRDMIGIAFTGSGKTVAFSLPLIMLCLKEETRMPLEGGEGPFGIIMAPARDLARQHAENLQHFATHLTAGGYPTLRIAACIGGEDLKTQMQPFNTSGCHMVVATPGRLKDHLSKGRFTLDLCSYIVLDEGDRMLDMGFDEDIKVIFSYFKRQRQTIIYSATMPKKIQDFAKEALVRPILVNASRAGAANLDIIQEVECVKAETRVVYLLTALSKTAPPVLIFAENKRDVDEVHEYLLLKGVAAVSVHGDKAQEERNEAIRAFKCGEKDVLVATDVAAKGMDFAGIQHVINFDMPKDIETYVHRIGRTGRSGKTGVATTFINRLNDEKLLLDLKGLLVEAGQRIPPVLLALEGPGGGGGGGGGGSEGPSVACPVCGGLGHRITECPKLERERRELAGQNRDFVVSGRGGEW